MAIRLKKFLKGRWPLVLSLSLLGGFLFQAIHFPAAWFLGPLLLAIVCSLRGVAPRTMPQGMKVMSQAVTGVAMGSVFQLDVFRSIGTWWLPLLGSFVVIVGFALLTAILLSKWTKLPLETTVLGSIPGAAAALLVMSDEIGADNRIVAFLHYFRITVVVILSGFVANWLAPGGGATTLMVVAESELHALIMAIVVAIAGAWMGNFMHLPAGIMLGPMILNILVQACGLPVGHWPDVIMNASYIILAISIGLRFEQESLLRMLKLLPFFLLQLVSLIVVSALYGGLLSFLTGTDLITGYLTTNPGGMDAIAVLALNTGANFAMVLTGQMLRMFTLSLFGIPIVRMVLFLSHRFHRVRESAKLSS